MEKGSILNIRIHVLCLSRKQWQKGKHLAQNHSTCTKQSKVCVPQTKPNTIHLVWIILITKYTLFYSDWVSKSMNKLEIKELNMQDTRQHFLETYSVIFNKVKWLIAARACPGFYGIERLGVFLLSQDGMLVYRRLFPHNLLGFPNNSPLPIYTHGWRSKQHSVLDHLIQGRPHKRWQNTRYKDLQLVV